MRTKNRSKPIPLIIDTRENLPWQFSPEFTVKRAKLWAGDYTITGLESRIVIERKSLGDFVQTVIHDWIRFRKELNRIACVDLACIIVEADVSDVMNKRYESEVHPESVMGKAAACYLDHGVPVLWWGHRNQCVPLVNQMLRLAATRWESEVDYGSDAGT